MAIETGTDTVKRGLAQMLNGGVIMPVRPRRRCRHARARQDPPATYPS